MEFDYFTEPVPFLIVRNYFNSEDRKLFLEELTKMKHRLIDGEHTGSAVGPSGEKKKNKGLFLYGPECPNSVILKMLDTNLTTVKKDAINKNIVYNYLRNHPISSTLINYYNNGDMYNTHSDEAILTSIYYTWEEPKPFTGGDLYFEEYKYQVPITNNCLLLFPSCVPHRVSKVENGSGRWAVSQFIMKRLGFPFRHNLFTYNKILSESDYKYIYNLIEHGSWDFSGKSAGDTVTKKFWHMDLSTQPLFTQTMVKKIEQISGRRFKLERVYANGHTFGTDGNWHIDDSAPNTWTFLYYINKDINMHWGGETQFLLEEDCINIFPNTNTGVLFHSNIAHRGKGPARDVYDLRVTLAWKLSEIKSE